MLFAAPIDMPHGAGWNDDFSILIGDPRAPGFFRLRPLCQA